MKVSICVPIYGTEKYIERCARSLFEQTYNNIEYVFVDDCTKDRSVEILNSVLNDYPQRKEQTFIISHETNQGLAGARLTGLKHASGDYVWFVDSDDYVERDAVAQCVPYCNSDYGIVFFNYTCEYAAYSKRNPPIIHIGVNDILKFRVSPTIWKCLVRRSLFYDNGIFPIIGLNHAEDLLLLARLILVSKRNYVLQSYLYHYECDNSDSYMKNVSIKSRESAVQVVLKITEFYYKYGKLNSYRIGLGFLMADTYYSLFMSDNNNKLLLKEERLLRKTSIIAYILTKLSVYLKSKKVLHFLKNRWTVRLLRCY